MAGRKPEVPVAVPADVFTVAESDRATLVIVTQDHNAKSSVPVYVADTETGNAVYECCFTVSG